MMSPKSILPVSFLFASVVAVSLAGAQPFNQDSGPDGIVSVEAEHHDNKTKGISGSEWVLVGPTGGFTGEAGMQVADGTEPQKNTNYAATSPGLEFQITFVKTGTHYIWVLGWGPDGGGDSCHAGLDGQEIPTSDNLSGWNANYRWSNTRYERTGAPNFEVTTAGVHTLNIWMREDGLIVDKIVLTTNPNFTLTGAEPGPPESTRGALLTASNPNPSDGAADVRRDAVLSWTPGASAGRHDVYFGAALADVEQASTTADPAGVYKGRIDPNFYDVGRLEFGRTYYWRIDEIDAPPANTIHAGSVWSFTAEPFAYAVENVIATASSSAAGKGPENTVNGSGLDGSSLHGNIGEGAMWLSDAAGPQPTWILFEFDKVHKLHEMWVWNSNESLEPVIGLGFKDVTIEYSADGVDFTRLGTTHEFAPGTGAAGYAHNTTIDMTAVAAKYVRLTANSNWKGLLPQFGLSEVRFFSIPVQAREPYPAAGATGAPLDLVLGFRAGREAGGHELYFSEDWAAVVDGAAPVATLTEARYGPLALDLGKTYYWRVDEVNDVQTPALWQGEVWDFKTIKSLVLDDFESYNDIDPPDPQSNRIFETWIDGFGVATNGALVGNELPAYAERTIVHSGRQSMPYFYDNSAGYSEASMTLSAQRNWTVRGIGELSLWFRGIPSNSAEPIYVAIANRTGAPAVIYHEDAGAAQIDSWTQWRIDVRKFADQGVNLADVDSLALGLGNKSNPQPGGSGILYFDDIGLSARPAPLVEVWLEAEAADVLGSSWRVYDDPTASGAKSIGSDNGDGNHNNVAPGAEWIATYNFTSAAGEYKVLLRGQEASDDSFWVRIPTAIKQTHEHPGQPGTGWVRFNGMDAPSGWAWDEVHSDDHGQAVVNWTLPEGANTLEIAKREDGVLLDAIVITNNLDQDQRALPETIPQP